MIAKGIGLHARSGRGGKTHPFYTGASLGLQRIKDVQDRGLHNLLSFVEYWNIGERGQLSFLNKSPLHPILRQLGDVGQKCSGPLHPQLLLGCPVFMLCPVTYLQPTGFYSL